MPRQCLESITIGRPDTRARPPFLQVASSHVRRKRLVRGASGMLVTPASVVAPPSDRQQPPRSKTFLTVTPLINGRDGRTDNHGNAYRLTHISLFPGARTAPHDGALASTAIEFPA